ncbi:catecholate siderophore receptor Fiu [Chitinimonas sp.]|uniref:catecholate siderophore receptor Fiu n=1 Tax=Chitinimonas sp. TaxID=1934313 RepID=UPI002F92632B
MAYIASKKHGDVQRLKTTALASALMLALPAGAAMAAEPAPAKKDDAVLPAVKVEAQTELPAYKADKASSPKLTQPLVNTTQSISVIKEELFKEQAATTLTEALRNSPGVSTFFLGENGNTNTGDAIYMRGFDTSSSIYVDGVRDLGSISRDVFNIEQIEIAKGPAGTDNGRGAPTGYINLSSKSPKLENALSGSVNVGSADFKRASLDWNMAIKDIEGAAFRLNLMAQDAGVVGRKEVENNRWGIAPSLAFGLGSNTRTVFSYLHVKQDNVPDGGVPTIGLPGYSSPVQNASGTTPAIPARPYVTTAAKVDPKNFYGSTADFDNVTADMFTARFEHDFSSNVTLRNTSRYGKTSQFYVLTGFMGSAPNLLTPNPANPDTWTVARSNRQLKDQRNEILTNQTNVTANIVAGGLEHSLSGGLEFIRENQTTYGYDGLGTMPAANLYHPNPNDAVTGYSPVRNGVRADGTTNTIGAYLFDTIKLSEQWQINGGLRFDHYNTSYESISKSTATSNPTLPVGTLVPLALEAKDNLVNWKAGVLFKPADNGSVYLSYATSQQPPGGANFALSAATNSGANPKYEPQKAKTAEFGTKWDLLNKQLAFTAAVYRTTVTNEIEQDPTDKLYYQSGEKRVQGVEVGLTGDITKNWSVNAGFSIADTEVVAGATVAADGVSRALNYTPKKTFTAWTTYKLPYGITIGGGARYADGLQRGVDGAVGTPSHTESYWVFDAMAAYAINRNVTVQLNVYNLGDKEYVAAINKSGYRYTPGAPRSAQLSANFAF